MTTATDIGLTLTQLAHVRAIINAVKRRGLPSTAAVIAIEAALAESGLRMYANGNNPRSLRLPHDAVGWDNASVGLFQQQVGGAPNSTANWGTTEELMNAEVSCGKFLDALQKTDWQHVSNWRACQNVQHSAYDGVPRKANNFNGEYGGNYHAQDTHAARIVHALWDAISTGHDKTPVKYWVDTFANAPVFGSPTSQVQTGTLFKGTNYVFGKRQGRVISTQQGHNHWWLKTDPDEGTGQWVSAYYLTRWGNDEAKDNNGQTIPDC
jgi:hypothetical protein